jgi:hypothetical protein
MFLIFGAALVTEPVWVGRFPGSGDLPAPWRVVRVGSIKPTQYKLATVAQSPAVEAHVESSMAMVARPVSVDMKQTPMLCWRWYIRGVVPRGNLGKKAGNDFAARIYVAFDMPDSAMSAATRFKLGVARRIFGQPLPDAAVTYVWDNRSPVGTAVKSPYTDRQQLIVSQSGNERAGRWTSERVDVEADFARAFAGRPGRISGVAVAADGDNTRTSGYAAFSDIHFVGREERCRA